MDYNADYNIDIPPCRETIKFSEVQALPVFGTDTGLFHVGHKALFVMERTTREKMVEYALLEQRAPIMETVNDEEGKLSFIFQMVVVDIDC